MAAALAILNAAWKLLSSPVGAAVAWAAASALAVMLIVASASNATLHRQVTAVTGERDAANQALGLERGNVASLQAGLDHQNAAVAAAAASYAQMQAQVAKARSAAQAASQAADKQVAAILARKPKDASCAAVHAMATGG